MLCNNEPVPSKVLTEIQCNYTDQFCHVKYQNKNDHTSHFVIMPGWKRFSLHRRVFSANWPMSSMENQLLQVYDWEPPVIGLLSLYILHYWKKQKVRQAAMHLIPYSRFYVSDCMLIQWSMAHILKYFIMHIIICSWKENE